MIQDAARFQAAMDRLDEANREDPRREVFRGKDYPKELLYALRMTEWLERLAPDASEALRLAVRGQHIRRWTIPRESYPKDRKGYLQWRTALGRFHAEEAGGILREAGCGEETAARVQSLVRKERLKSDPEAQLLEDAACLVFLESYFLDFSRQHEEEKIVAILRKTWAKMSPRGREAALGLALPPEAGALVQKALSSA
ncbi:MAG: hypothetical protein A3J27_09270 [Candidatus Tectomicrobia bacterium RIFCSPLOWO2_12_FULL_69_37]|nr:MAG: hypothetical protein A3J27_09270 [Candidatus Tectomicrobia bacterium RIFCSPLOWO2_12_FULL_69_37]